jgi:hypothetical protein
MPLVNVPHNGPSSATWSMGLSRIYGAICRCRIWFDICPWVTRPANLDLHDDRGTSARSVHSEELYTVLRHLGIQRRELQNG